MDITYHYPPELLQLLIETIPRLSRGKKDLLLFFRGAGVPEGVLAPLHARLAQKVTAPGKFEIARTVLVYVNEKGEAGLRERREILRRVVECEDFSTCWPEDQLKAKGLVAEVRRVVEVKDSFSRMNHEREREARIRRDELATKQRIADELRQAREGAKRALFAAFADPVPQARGLKAESALNSLFKAHGISVREAFRVLEEGSGKVWEQIDGVIELDGHLYLVEAKWLSTTVDINDVSRHLIRVYHRGQTRGLFMSATEFSAPALATCKEALQQTVVALCVFDELVAVLERAGDLREMLRTKVLAAQTDKNPFHRIA